MSTLSGFNLTIEGDYFVTDGQNKGLKRYSFEVRLPSDTVMAEALSIIKNKILDRMLKKNYDDYISYRTYQITRVEPFGDAKVEGGFSLWSSSRFEVESYIRKEELPVKVKFYPSLMGLREAVQLAEADESRFLLNQKQLEEDFIFTESLRYLNPEMFDEGEFEVIEPDDGESDVLAGIL